MALNTVIMFVISVPRGVLVRSLATCNNRHLESLVGASDLTRSLCSFRGESFAKPNLAVEVQKLIVVVAAGAQMCSSERARSLFARARTKAIDKKLAAAAAPPPKSWRSPFGKMAHFCRKVGHLLSSLLLVASVL